MDEKGRVWFTSRVRPPANPEFCKQGLGPSVGEALPARARRTAICRCTTRRRGKFTLISTCFPTPSSRLRRGREQHAVDERRRSGERRRRLAQPQDLRGDRRRGRSRRAGRALILDTNGNGKRDDYVEPDQPVDPAKDKRVVAALYGVAVNPVDGTVWGTVARLPRRGRPARSRARIRRNRARRSLRAAVAGLRPARRRHRPQRRVLGVARERPSRELRPAQVQGPAQRTDRDRQALPRGLDAPSLPRAAVRDVTDPGSAEASYYTLGRPVRHLRARQERADRHRQCQRVAARAGRRQVGQSRASPIRWASTPNGWTAASTIRTPAGRARGCGRRTSTRAPFHIEGGKGTPAEGGQVPAPPRSAGSVADDPDENGAAATAARTSRLPPSRREASSAISR